MNLVIKHFTPPPSCTDVGAYFSCIGYSLLERGSTSIYSTFITIIFIIPLLYDAGESDQCIWDPKQPWDGNDCHRLQRLSCFAFHTF